MINTDLYKIMIKRKSIRKFKMEPLTSETLENIIDYASQIQSLFPMKTKLEYLNSANIKGIFSIKAPHYVLLYSEQKDNYLMNGGYILEQLDLYLSASGIGACWLGMAKPPEGILEKDGLQFVIMLAFGEPSESLHRQQVSEFKRKTISEISNCSDGNHLLEAVRLAPSATNSQPWYIHLNNSELIISREKLNVFKVKFFDKINQIDIGIACAFTDIFLKEQGKKVNFTVIQDHKKYVKDGYQYMITSQYE